MYITKIKVRPEYQETYKLHQKIDEMFPHQKRMFHSFGNIAFVISEFMAVTNTNSILSAKIIEPESDLNKDEYEFTTRLCPTKCISTRSGNKVKHTHEPLEKNKLSSFIQKRFNPETTGVELIECSATMPNFLWIKKPKNPIPFYAMDIKGRIKIVDKSKFINTLSNGLVGRGKSFGFSALNIQI